MKLTDTTGKTEPPVDPVWELYIENTSAFPQVEAFYAGPDTPRLSVVPRGNKVGKYNKSNCAMTLAMITAKLRQLRGELSEHSEEERKEILKTREPKSWLHTLADTFGRGGDKDQLVKIFNEYILRMLYARGGRGPNARIDKETGKLMSPACLDSHVTEKFPARLRIMINERVGGPYHEIVDEKQLLKLAERLEDTPGYWENHLFPLDLNLMEARATNQAAGGVDGQVFPLSTGRAKASRAMASQQDWFERGEPANMPKLKFKFLKLIRAGHDHACIELIEANPALCAAKFPPNRDCALLTAITHKRTRVINYLLERADVDVNRANDHGVTPLLKAAHINNFDLIKTLVEKKDANCLVKNKMGANVIYEAAFGGGHDAYLIIKYFHEHEKWKVPCDQQTNDAFLPLTLAVWRRCDERTIRYLIEHTADLNVADFYGETPYYKAIKYGYFVAVNLLIELGGDKLDRTKMPSRHLTDRGSDLFGAVHHGDLKRVKELLREGNEDIDEAELEFERSPLHEAVDLGHLHIVQELIGQGANVFIQNQHGRIPRDFLPWKRASIVQQIEDILKKAEEEWIEREMEKLPGLQSAI